MLLKFIWLCIIFVLVGVGYIFYVQNPDSGMFMHAQEGVKGISTNKSEEISNQLKKEVDSGFNHMQKQVLDLKVSDIFAFFDKGQKITDDFKVFQEDLKRDIESFNKSK